MLIRDDEQKIWALRWLIGHTMTPLRRLTSSTDMIVAFVENICCCQHLGRRLDAYMFFGVFVYQSELKMYTIPCCLAGDRPQYYLLSKRLGLSQGRRLAET